MEKTNITLSEKIFQWRNSYFRPTPFYVKIESSDTDNLFFSTLNRLEKTKIDTKMIFPQMHARRHRYIITVISEG